MSYFTKNSLPTRTVVFILFLLLNTIPLILPALYNGYPLVYSDSGTYINSGFIGEVPIDRPIVYGLFIRHMSLAYSLWFVIIVQAWIVALCIFLLVKRFISNKVFLVSTSIIYFLSLTTGISNYISQIMPDIFSGVIIIGVALIFTAKRMQLHEYLLSILVIFAAITHLSNMITIAGLMIVTLLLTVFKLAPKINFFRIVLISIIPFLSLFLINKIYNDKFQLSRAGNVFIIARLIEAGIVKDYLTDNCGKKNYELCNSINKIPNQLSVFLYDDNSPLYDSGCKSVNWTYCWEEKNEEYGAIVKDIITTPVYLKRLIPIYLKDFYKQLFDFDIGPLTPMTENSPVQSVIASKLKNELEAYKNTTQYKGALEFRSISKIQFFIVLFSFVGCIVFFCLRKKLLLNKEQLVLIAMLFIGIIGNALTIGIFSTAVNRYEARIIWIIPVVALLLSYLFINRFELIKKKI